MAIDMVIIEAGIPARLPVFRDWDLEALDEEEAQGYLGRPTLTAEDDFDEAE
jgi:hypothetical protein